MKIKQLLTLSLLCVSSAGLAFHSGSHRIGIQGALATGGNLGIGIIDYTPVTEWGVTFSGSFNNASYENRTFTPVIFGGLRKQIAEHTYFAYGIDALGTFGKKDGLTIDSDYAIGPYISLEQMLTGHLMLSGWIEPYQYQYQKLGGYSVSTHNIFAAGGVALNYFF